MPLPRPLRFRRRLGPRRYFALAAIAALAAGALVARITLDAAAATARWGPGRPVPVATRDLPAGAELARGDIELAVRPTALLPHAELARDPVGRRLAHPLVAGEVVLADRLAPNRASEVAARLPAGTVGVAVPHDGRGLRLVLGDRVDVLATFDAETDTRDPTFAVARAATVVDVGEEGVTVAVPSADAPRVAFALAAGVVTLTLVP
jgi:Flp pilus assembly protein CpaB